MLKNCLGLRDLEEIQKRGANVFKLHFADKAVFAWKSVVRARSGNLDVPWLFEGGHEVILLWSWLGCRWNSSDPALRFAS
jgi:hypothetical protein